MRIILLMLCFTAISVSIFDESIIWTSLAWVASSVDAYDAAILPSGIAVFTETYKRTFSQGNFNLTTASGHAMFIARCDPNSLVNWAFAAGLAGNHSGRHTTLDTQINVLVAGEYEKSITFCSTTFSNIKMEDIFVVKLDLWGSLMYVISEGNNKISSC